MPQEVYYILAISIGGLALIIPALTYRNSKKVREDSKSELEQKYKPSVVTNYTLGKYDKNLYEFSPKLTIHNTSEVTLTISNLTTYGDIRLTNGEIAKHESPNKAEKRIVINAGQTSEVDFKIHLNGSNISGLSLFLKLTAENTKGTPLNINEAILSEKFVPRDFL